MTPEKQDLIILAADKDCKTALSHLLKKTRRLGIKSISSKILEMPRGEGDAGCRIRGHDILRVFSTQYRHALLIYDLEGCGAENLTCAQLEEESENKLRENGWGERAATIVIDPELEVWVWSDSPEVEQAMNWTEPPRLMEYLHSKGFLPDPNQIKPQAPKDAFRKILRKTRTPVSAAIFGDIADRVSLSRCTDRAFGKLKEKLLEWFGQE